MAGILEFIDDIGWSLGNAARDLTEIASDPTLRLGVTGLSRAGKTVFITSLVANLINRGRMIQLDAEQKGRIEAAFLEAQPDDSIPRFDYEDQLSALTGPEPFWPEGTRNVSQLRLSLRLKPKGFMSSFKGTRNLHLDIVDYPGEWILDLPLLDKSFAEWSRETLDLAMTEARKPFAEEWYSALSSTDPNAKFSDHEAKTLAKLYTTYLNTCRKAGFSALTPGRFLLPGELEGSPALTFTPLPEVTESKRGSIYREFERRYEAYKRVVVKPFFREHFARIDRQIVLADVMGAIHSGPAAMNELRVAMADILRAFKPGANNWLQPLIGKRIDRVLFAATKADFVHHSQHKKLAAILDAMVSEAQERAKYSGASVRTVALAALRTTTEQDISLDGESVPAVRGRLPDGRDVALYAGELPEDPSHLLHHARLGKAEWLQHDYQVMNFAPPIVTLKPGDGPAHIRLDLAAEFLLGDRL